MRMRNIGLLILAVLVAAIGAGPPPRPVAQGGQAAPENLADWEWYLEVPVPRGDRLADFVLTPAVFDGARVDLGDLRLIDGQGRPVPYALRIRRAEDELRPLDARQLNRASHTDHSVEVTLDLSPNAPEHNQLAVTAEGGNYRRRLLVQGSPDDKDWRTLVENGDLVHFRVGARLVDLHTFRYPPSNYHYLRVRLFPDRSQAADRPELRTLLVSRTIQVPGEDVSHTVAPAPREPVRGDGGPGSRWVLDLGARVPIERLQVDVAEDEFTRPFRLEQAEKDQPAQVLVQGEWRRRPGDPREPLKIDLPAEATGRRLNLIVTDFRNPPLTLQQVRYLAPAREIIFSPAAVSATPLRLYFGNPGAEAPRYDFASALPARLDPPPSRVTPGEPQRNPEYKPTLPPWTERHPWLVDLALGGASLVLLLILADLARTTIRKHDAPAAAPTAGP
jgi:hypothetical protein